MRIFEYDQEARSQLKLSFFQKINPSRVRYEPARLIYDYLVLVTLPIIIHIYIYAVQSRKTRPLFRHKGTFVTLPHSSQAAKYNHEQSKKPPLYRVSSIAYVPEHMYTLSRPLHACPLIGPAPSSSSQPPRGLIDTLCKFKSYPF